MRIKDHSESSVTIGTNVLIKMQKFVLGEGPRPDFGF